MLNRNWTNLDININETLINITTVPPLTLENSFINNNQWLRCANNFPGNNSAFLKKQLKWMFLLHSYGFACCFLVLAFYSFFSLLNIRSLLTARPYMSTINMFLCLLGASRATLLFIDPYSFKHVMPQAVCLLIWDCGLPSTLAAFALLQLALLRLTQLRIGPKFLASKSCLPLIISLHFTCIVALDITISINQQLYLFRSYIEIIFLIWGLIISGTFVITGRRAMDVVYRMPTSALLERDPDLQYKGIMQLAMLAPYNNLATSVCAALVPTLLAPRLIQQSAPSSNSVPVMKPEKSCITPKKRTPESEIEINSDNDETKTFLNESDSKKGTKRIKKLSWVSDQKNVRNNSKKSENKKYDNDSDDNADATLLPQQKPGDLTLHTILNHIAYVNRTRGVNSEGAGETRIESRCRKKRLITVLRITLATTFLAFLLIIMNVFQLIIEEFGDYKNVHVWLIFQTASRLLELLIGCTCANLTKQPVRAAHAHHHHHHHHRTKTAKSLFM